MTNISENQPLQGALETRTKLRQKMHCEATNERRTEIQLEFRNSRTTDWTGEDESQENAVL
jgi:hypothetical protein